MGKEGSISTCAWHLLDGRRFENDQFSSHGRQAFVAIYEWFDNFDDWSILN
jgi:hypothetical protein